MASLCIRSVLGFRVYGIRDLGFRGLGFRVVKVLAIGFRVWF